MTLSVLPITTLQGTYFNINNMANRPKEHDTKVLTIADLAIEAQKRLPPVVRGEQLLSIYATQLRLRHACRLL